MKFLNKKKVKISNWLINKSKILYENSYKYILLIWSIFSAILFLGIHYPNCIIEYTNFLIFITIGLLIPFLLLISHIIIHLIIFRDNEEALVDEENSESGNITVENKKFYLLIIPIYALWIYGLSKIIIYLYKFFIVIQDITQLDIVLFLTWFLVFIISIRLWFKFKKKAKKVWSMPITIYIIFVTTLHLCWNSLYLPIIKGMYKIGDCVKAEILKKNNKSKSSIVNKIIFTYPLKNHP